VAAVFDCCAINETQANANDVRGNSHGLHAYLSTKVEDTAQAMVVDPICHTQQGTSALPPARGKPQRRALATSKHRLAMNQTMNVEEGMTTIVQHCSPKDSLADAARVLWDHDCGCAPVLDDNGDLCGILTDRDICMAAYTSGRSLHELNVGSIMTRDVATIGPKQSLRAAEETMRTRGVRRLLVLDEVRQVVGVLGCNDLLRWVDDGGSNDTRHHDATHLVRTLAKIGERRNSNSVTRTVVAPTASPQAAFVQPTDPVTTPMAGK
jgi:CBS domain-containing protein